jgi:hypothetical protein
MPRPNRKTVRLSANVPEVILKEWEELQAQENGYRPLPNRSQRVEFAILEHIRVMKKRICTTLEDTPSAEQFRERPYDDWRDNCV